MVIVLPLLLVHNRVTLFDVLINVCGASGTAAEQTKPLLSPVPLVDVCKDIDGPCEYPNVPKIVCSPEEAAVYVPSTVQVLFGGTLLSSSPQVVVYESPLISKLRPVAV